MHVFFPSFPHSTTECALWEKGHDVTVTGAVDSHWEVLEKSVEENA